MINNFEKFQNQFADSHFLSDFRNKNFETFKKSEIPTKKNEQWHYLSAKNLIEGDRSIALLKKHSLLIEPPINLINQDFYQFIFINGKFDAQISSYSSTHEELKDKIKFEFNSNKNEVKDIKENNYFTLLNSCYFYQGLEIIVNDDIQLTKPIQIVSYISEPNVETHPRLQVRLGKSSKLNLIEQYVGISNGYFQNSYSEIHLGDSAKLEYIRIQNEDVRASHYGSIKFYHQENSNLNSNTISIGANISRVEIESYIQGQNSNVQLNGLAVGKENQTFDHTSKIVHESGNSESNQLYKAVLDDSAKSYFTGKIVINKKSQKANSIQLNKNLLLSEKAEASSRPQLEILADDVKATHGATVGQIDQEQVFYLQSRGINKTQAVQILSQGFMDEIIFKIENSLIQNLARTVLSSNKVLHNENR